MRSLFSASWYRFAGLKPRLRPHAEIHRQMFRGAVWYVLQDHQSGRFHRISPAVNLMLCLMDGHRTIQTIWETVAQKIGDDPPTQDETIQLLAQLHASDLLQSEMPPDVIELSERSDRQGRRELLQKLRNPLSFRLPLLDPDRFLDMTVPLVRPLFSVAGFCTWLVLIAVAGVLLVLHWPELTTNIADRLLATENVLIVLAIYPLIKALHELGHAYATKVWGGEVHELGLMLLVFIPVAYVDASNSSAFILKRRRIIVGAAGILVEMTLAAVAMIVWTQATPGLVRTIAFNVMLIGGVSTLAFNGNPLLRFDGYYILADLLEIPNLAGRANKLFFYVLQRGLFGLETIENPCTGRGEAKWLFAYAVASFLYRTVVSLGIALFLASRFFVLGTALALWAGVSAFVLPVLKGVRYLFTDRNVAQKRRRVFGVTAACLALAATVLFLLPLPYATVAEGVVWVPDRAELRTAASGFVQTIAATPQSAVESREALIVLDDPVILSQVAVRNAQMKELVEKRDAALVSDRVQAEILDEQIRHLRKTLDLLKGRKDDLVVRSAQAGLFYPTRPEDMPGRYFKKGELLGYVVRPDDPVIRVVVSQSDVDLIRLRTDRVDVLFVDDLDTEHPARISREVPGADQEIPSAALTTQGGGTIAVDPAKPQKALALFKLFQFDVALLSPTTKDFAGERVYVRFDHGHEPIAWRVLRGARQAFLSRFHV